MDHEQTRTGEVAAWLLEGVNDAVENLRQAAELARNPELRGFFDEQSAKVQDLATEVSAALNSPDAAALRGNGTLVGVLHRMFTQGRDALARDSDKAIVAEAVRAMDLAESRFTAVVDDEHSPREARDLASRTREALRAQRETLEELRGQYA